jgi:DNA-binding NarL/FixJ family response regulator
MPLDVLIATPSGPFGELIRLTLEADPTFHCTLIDKGEELRAVIQTSNFQAVVYDCSCSQPGPDEVAQMMRAEYPSLALLFIPAETDPDMAHLHGIQADGTISRPFDASLLPELVHKAVQKRTAQPDSLESSETEVTSRSWIKTFQEEIRKTSAFNGLIIQNGAVTATTPEISLLLQEQAVTAILRYWNPADTSDLMRYIKDPETNQEWMMYATRMADSGVLALLFQPQTPVTKVRIQTVQLARQLSASQALALPVIQPDEEVAEFQMPLKLQEILSETTEEKPKSVSTSFPVEWFKETDLPKNTGIIGKEEPLPKLAGPEAQIETGIQQEEIPVSKPITVNQLENQKEEAENSFQQSEHKPKLQTEESLFTLQQPELEEPTTEDLEYKDRVKEPSVNLSESLPVSLDLGSFQAVDLIAKTPTAAGLDSLQPVPLKSASLPVISEDCTPQEESAAPEIASSSNISEAVNSSFSEMSFSDMPLESAEQSPEKSLPDIESDISEIVSEPELSFSEKFGLTKGIPEDLTDIPDFENLPYFLTTPANKNPVDESVGIATGDMEAAPAPSGLYDLQLDGEPAMENVHSEEEQKNDQPVQFRDESYESQETVVPSEAKEGDLFTRMNQLQSAAENKGTETITAALIPRQESFILQRQIAGVLNQSMDRLCQAFGWKLENLTIRPTYLQWTVAIPSMFTPEDMVAIVRQQTTQFLFKTIPGLQPIADGEDIWAPESMMASSIDFVPSNHWQNFILRRKNSEIA